MGRDRRWLAALAAFTILGFDVGWRPADTVVFTKTVLDSRFISEGVAVADINRDGKTDILAGNVWFEGPNWKPHEIAPYVEVDPKKAWSNCFHTWAEDLNRDGWPDQILIGMPGEKAVWRENPKGGPAHWKERLIWRNAGNESPLYEDLFGDGKRVLIMAYDDKYLAWFEPASDPEKEWIPHPIGPEHGPGSQRYSHGLGVGDLDGDGRKEVVTTGGYYSPPKNPRNEPWTFAKADLGPDCAHMLSPGPNQGILTTSAHARGVWHHQPDSNRSYKRRVIDETISVTHAAQMARLGKSKALNLITGKRKWGHPPGVDVGSEEPHWLVRYEFRDGKWARHLIDRESGVGTQIVVQDIDRDGLQDIVAANKNGVFLFTQVRGDAKTR